MLACCQEIASGAWSIGDASGASDAGGAGNACDASDAGNAGSGELLMVDCQYQREYQQECL